MSKEFGSYADKEAARRVNKHRQRRPSDLFFFPPINLHEPVSSLKLLYPSMYMRFHDISSTNLKGVPVTSPYDVEHTYHVIQFQDHEGGPVFQLPVREADGYVGGFRCLLHPDDADTEVWFELCNFGLPRHLFVNVVSTDYKFAYNSIRAIRLTKRILPEAFNFLLGIRTQFVASNPIPRKRKLPPTTPEGILYIDTILFVCGEGRRFRECMKLTCSGLKSIKPVSPSDGMEKSINSWANGCEHMLSLHLAEMEEDMGLITSVHDLARHGFRRFVAEAALKDLELKTNGMLRCIGPNGRISLEYLCGGDILLIKHEKELVRKILMRKKGYRGAFHEKMKFVVDANGTWRKDDKLAITKEDIETYFSRRQEWSLTLANLAIDTPTQHSSCQDLQMQRCLDAGGSSCQNEGKGPNLYAVQSSSQNDEDTSEQVMTPLLGAQNLYAGQVMMPLQGAQPAQGPSSSTAAGVDVLQGAHNLYAGQVMMPLQGVQPAQGPSSSTAAGVDVLQEKVAQIIKVKTKSPHEGCLRRRLVLQVLMEFVWLLSPGVDSSASAGGELQRKLAEKAIDRLLNSEGMQDIVKTMVPKVFSKEVLFDLMSEYIGLFPDWLETNKGKISEEQCDQFQKQLDLIVDLTDVYNDNPSDFSKIMKLMYKIGGFGLPPSDIVRGLSPRLVEQLLNGMVEMLEDLDRFFPLDINHSTI